VAASTAPPALRDRILDVALERFATKGYAGTSVRELVEAVGCTKPSLYYHFGSKEDLFLELVRTRIDGFHRVLSEATAGTQSAEQALLRVTAAILEGVRQSPLSMRLLITAEHHPDKGQPEVDLRSMHEAFLLYMVTLINDGQARGELRADLPAESLAWSFIGAVHVRALGIALGHDVPADAHHLVVDIFARGALAPES
jgi:TetR/AcrR family transcriptional regulator